MKIPPKPSFPQSYESISLQQFPKKDTSLVKEVRHI